MTPADTIRLHALGVAGTEIPSGGRFCDYARHDTTAPPVAGDTPAQVQGCASCWSLLCHIDMLERAIEAQRERADRYDRMFRWAAVTAGLFSIGLWVSLLWR